MKRDEALSILESLKPELEDKFGVTSLALFGSTARDTATDDSDIDILVSFDGRTSSERFFGVQFLLEDTFKCPIDLVSEKAVRAAFRESIEKDRIRV